LLDCSDKQSNKATAAFPDLGNAFSKSYQNEWNRGSCQFVCFRYSLFQRTNHSSSAYREKRVSCKATAHSILWYIENQWALLGRRFLKNWLVFDLGHKIWNWRTYDQRSGFSVYLFKEILVMGQTKKRLHRWFRRYFGFGAYRSCVWSGEEERTIWVLFVGCL